MKLKEKATLKATRIVAQYALAGDKLSAKQELQKTEERGEEVARLTGLEPATPGVTGRYSNQLSYNRASIFAFRRVHSRRTQDLGW